MFFFGSVCLGVFFFFLFVGGGLCLNVFLLDFFSLKNLIGLKEPFGLVFSKGFLWYFCKVF